MDSIIDHQRDPSQAIPIEDRYITTKSGQKWLQKTMKGWKLLITWKDKSKAWINLADMKEAHLVETGEYARGRRISDEPAFAWWVPFTLRKREERSYPRCCKELDKEDDLEIWDRDTYGC